MFDGQFTSFHNIRNSIIPNKWKYFVENFLELATEKRFGLENLCLLEDYTDQTIPTIGGELGMSLPNRRRSATASTRNQLLRVQL